MPWVHPVGRPRGSSGGTVARSWRKFPAWHGWSARSSSAPTFARDGGRATRLALDRRTGRQIEVVDQRQRPGAVGGVDQHRGQPAINDRLALRRYGAQRNFRRATALATSAAPVVGAIRRPDTPLCPLGFPLDTAAQSGATGADRT